ncbi:MAG: lauroyl acyltransferase [Ferrovibrio sp.]|uniref:LpxL/LpxP family acyltransferase n=1 Tax=Ferrovibrio sp. TaxID=1917215 RepID=UPI002636747B|nr:lauroyl acyltransferase [Ferrovibrio sp.]MCW0232849.1 lauroyl acyltransferase [Ferrovibrio sp.]
MRKILFPRAEPHEYVAAWGARLALALFGALPLDRASALGGWIARKIGPHLGTHKIAARNLAHAMPELTSDQQQVVLNGMWDNLGRVVAEYAHLGELDIAIPGQPSEKTGHVEVVGIEHVQAIRDSGKPAMFFSAHYGNWELNGLAAQHLGMHMLLVYRAANNPLTEEILQGLRTSLGGRHVPKGIKAAREILAMLKSNEHVAMLVDQKLSNGIAVPFFGRDAMTTPALAEFALRMNCPMVPAYVERLSGTHFRLTIEPPMQVEKTGDHSRDVYNAMLQVNRKIEGWIRARPDHWFWVHRRWPKE